jgi:hypothetical protein
MAGRHLTLEDLHRFDEGRLGLAFGHAIRRVLADIADRPTDKTARGLAITLKFAPVQGSFSRHIGTVTRFTVTAEILDKLPRSRTGDVVCELRGDADDGYEGVFNDECSEEVAQLTFSMHADPEPDDPLCDLIEPDADED